MIEQPSWMPSDEEINAVCNEDDHPDYQPSAVAFVTNCELIRALIATAVEKALAESNIPCDVEGRTAAELARLAARVAELEGEVAKLRKCVEAADQMRSIAVDEPGGASDWCYYDVAREEVEP